MYAYIHINDYLCKHCQYSYACIVCTVLYSQSVSYLICLVELHVNNSFN